jgi:hypothetical protein
MYEHIRGILEPELGLGLELKLELELIQAHMIQKAIAVGRSGCA